MKYFIIFLMLVMVNGCTSTIKAPYEGEQLHQQIVEGKIIQVGDNVKVVTSDGMRHKFKVEAITEDRIIGKRKIHTGASSYEYQDYDIAITDVVTLKIVVEEEEKSTALILGIPAAGLLALLIAFFFFPPF
jgi:hypothetical protein